jgi:hypothetical protein
VETVLIPYRIAFFSIRFPSLRCHRHFLRRPVQLIFLLAIMQIREYGTFVSETKKLQTASKFKILIGVKIILSSKLKPVFWSRIRMFLGL